jgi:thiamine biosynthesis lipoprotein
MVGVACSPASPRLISRSYEAMGTAVTLTAWTADEAKAQDGFAAVFAELDRLDALLSVWKAGSDVVRINAAAGREAVAVSAETIEVLLAAEKVSDWTAGKFDVTFAALSDVWKFDHDQDNRVPSEAEIAARLPQIDYRAVMVDATARTVQIVRPGVKVHLGGIGKGYAVDRAVSMLRAFGLANAMVQFGGDLYVSGQPGDEPWHLGISDPRGGVGESFATLSLADATLSTSGDYERFFVKDGVRYMVFAITTFSIRIPVCRLANAGA